MVMVWIFDEDREELERMGSLIRCEPWFHSCTVKLFCGRTCLLEHARRHSREGDLVFFSLSQGRREDLEAMGELARIVPRAGKVLLINQRQRFQIESQVEHDSILIKPVKRAALRRAFFTALERRQNREELSFPVKTRNGTYQVFHKEIFYLEKELRQIHLYLESGEVVCYGTFQDLEGYLTSSFYQCHQSYIVNLDKVVRLEQKRFYLENGQSLIISQSRYHQAREYYLDYLHSKI